MKVHRQHAPSLLAAGLIVGVFTCAGCMSSTYSVEVPAPAPSDSASRPIGGVDGPDVAELTRAVQWDKIPVAAVTEGF